MVGRWPGCSKLVVTFVADDKAARKKAFDLVEENDIMASYPDFGLGHTGLGKVTALAGELIAVFPPREGGIRCRQLLRASIEAKQPRIATASAIVIHRGKHIFLTVNHCFDDAPAPPVVRYKETEKEILTTRSRASPTSTTTILRSILLMPRARAVCRTV